LTAALDSNFPCSLREERALVSAFFVKEKALVELSTNVTSM
jgi:hypothetical protein